MLIQHFCGHLPEVTGCVCLLQSASLTACVSEAFASLAVKFADV